MVKLLAVETESPHLSAFLEGGARMVSSRLLETEVRRALRRRSPDLSLEELDRLLGEVTQILARFFLFDVDRGVLTRAGDLREPALRSLDAIHLATALSVPGGPVAFVSYDARQAAAAEEAGLSVEMPGR